jgi:hypothetical protein
MRSAQMPGGSTKCESAEIIVCSGIGDSPYDMPLLILGNF